MGKEIDVDKLVEPELLAKGKIALYKTASGGLHLTMQIDGEEEEKHFEIPPMMVKMLSANPMFSHIRGQM